MNALLLSAFSELLNQDLFGYLLHAFEIVAAELLFGVFFKKRNFFALRLTASLTVYLLLSAELGAFFGKYFPSLRYLAAFLLSVGVFPVCFESNLWNVLFCCVAAIAIQNLSYSAGAIVVSAIGWDPTVIALYPALVQTAVYLAVFIACFAVCFKRLKGGEEGFGTERVAMVVLSLILTAVVYGVQYDKQSSAVQDYFQWRVMFISYDVLLLFLLIGMYDRGRLRRENLILGQLRESEARQYEFDKRAIEMVNIKCHDLKHRISALRAMAGEEQERAFDDVESAVMVYDSIAKTGCRALDVILTNKCLFCEKFGIRFTYVVDGEKLSFMKPVDIYSLFGNAIDNAIRAVRSEEEAEKRVINLSVTAHGKFLSIHIENYCRERPLLRDGLPVTTQADGNVHGYGMVSMQRIAESYGGVMSVEWKASLFLLDFTVPIP